MSKSPVKKVYRLFLFYFCILACMSCEKNAMRQKIYNAKYKSISRLLKEGRDANIHMDKKACSDLITLISERSSSSILELEEEEKNELLRVAITASIDLNAFFKAVSARLEGGTLPKDIKDDVALKKELISSVDISPDVRAVRTLLSDYEYVQKGECDSVMLAMAIIIARATHIVGNDATLKALKDGSSEEVQDLISKTHIEVVLYSYGIINKRSDIKNITFAGVKLIDLLPEMNVSF